MSQQIKLWQKIKNKTTDKQMISDAQWLAKSWERAISAIDCPSKGIGLQMFYELIGAYARGQGNRSHQKYVSAIGFMAILVMIRISDEDYPDLWFPALTRLGMNTTEGFEEAVKEWRDA